MDKNRFLTTPNLDRAIENQHLGDKIEKAHDAITALADLCNSDTAVCAEVIANSLTFQHRYLQAEVVTAIWKALGIYGDIPKELIDPRNQFAVQTAKRMNEAI